MNHGQFVEHMLSTIEMKEIKLAKARALSNRWSRIASKHFMDRNYDRSAAILMRLQKFNAAMAQIERSIVHDHLALNDARICKANKILINRQITITEHIANQNHYRAAMLGMRTTKILDVLEHLMTMNKLLRSSDLYRGRI